MSSTYNPTDYKKLIQKFFITLIESREYITRSLRYSSFNSVFDLSFRTQYFIQELNNTTSHITFSLLDNEKEQYLKTLSKANTLATTHLQDILVNNYKTLNITQLLQEAKNKALSYQSKPRTTLTPNELFFLNKNEYLLELITPYTANYIK